MHFKMSSAIRFNLDQSKIVFSGNGLMHRSDSKRHRFIYIVMTGTRFGLGTNTGKPEVACYFLV